MAGRITNAILLNEIKHLQKEIASINKYLEKQNDKIIKQEEKINRNSIAIAGMKGITAGVSAVITLVINAIIAYFSVKKV